MSIELYFKKVEQALPELACTTDLVRVGIFSSISQAVKARERGECPDCLYLSDRRIMYPKECVMAWLKERSTLKNTKPKKEPNDD